MGEVAKLTDDAFTHRAIQKYVLKKATGHWLTMFPLLPFIGGSLWSLLLGPSEASILSALLGGATSAINFVWIYFIRGERIAEEYTQELLREKELAERNEFENRERARAEEAVRLYKDCRDAHFLDGAKAIKDIAQGYSKISQYLHEKVLSGKTPSAERYLHLTGAAYSQAISFIAQGLALFKALETVDLDELKREIGEWNKELKRLGEDDKIREELLRTRIANNQKRVESVEERRAKVFEILAECETLEAALADAYLKVVELMTNEDMNAIVETDAARQLENAVNAAIRVEQRLQGKDTAKEDEMYRELGQSILNKE